MQWLNRKALMLEQGAIRAMFDRANTMQDVISMGIGEPDMPTPAPVCEGAALAMEQGFTHYTPNAGTAVLRKAVAEKSYIKDLGYDPAKEIIITNGGMGALSLLFLVILNEGDEVLIQDPQWLNYEAQITYCGGVPVRVPASPEHRFEMQPEDIEKRIGPRTKALLINSPNNPTGSVMSPEALKEIAEIAKRRDILVITDEVYNTLVYGSVPCVSIASFEGMKERTVVINSFSKAFAMTGWRIGFAAGPGEIIGKMTECMENFNSCASSVGQYAALKALDHPELSDEIRSVFSKRRELFLKGLDDIPGIKYIEPAGAFYVFVDIRSFGLSSREFCDRLLDEAGVVWIPGSAFGECGEGFARAAYTCGEEKLRKAVDRVEAFCGKISSERGL